MTSPVHDVVIIGGGPAGCCAARLLASWDRDVLVLTRPGRTAALAESLPPSCARLFDRIGIRAEVDAAGFVRTTGNTVWWGEADSRTEFFADGARGWQVERDRFDALLLDSAEAAGARVERTATVRDITLLRQHLERRSPDSPPAVPGFSPSAPEASGHALGESRNVRYEIGGEVRDVHARWILDASGRAGMFARRGWRRSETGGRTLALVAFWERAGGWNVPDPTHTLVMSHAGGWVWSVPISATCRCIAVMIDPARTRLRGREQLEQLYNSQLRDSSSIARLLRESTRVSPVRACDASPYGAHRVSDDGILLVGDAASFVDPLSSFGVKKAMASAWLAAVVVHSALDDPGITLAARELYETRERAMYEGLSRRHAELSAEAAGTHANGFWSDRAAASSDWVGDEPDVAALRADPQVLAAFANLRARPAVRMRPAINARRTTRPIVSGNRIILAEHMVCAAFPTGIRWVRDVDLVRLVGMAAAHDQVPDLWEAYNRSSPPVPLPDFLGALALLLGKGILEHS